MQPSSHPYAIMAPRYASNSGGIKVLYALADRLVRAGHKAYIINDQAKKLPAMLKARDFIAVYPEIYKGNPLNAKYVARYVLNKPGLIGGDEVYDAKEKVFVYSDMFKDSVKNKIEGLLTLVTIEGHIFKPVNFKHRDKTCFYVGKGTFDKREIPGNCLEITRTYPPTREKLAHLLNKCHTLYCFDPATILVQEAALCGCETVLLANTLEQHLNSEFKGLGIKIGKVNSTQYAKYQLDEINDTFTKQLAHFISVTQDTSNW